MSNTASTITVIVTVVTLVGAMFAGQVVLLGRVLDSFRAEIESRFRNVEGRLDKIETHLDGIERVIVREHGERITRLEERL